MRLVKVGIYRFTPKFTLEKYYKTGGEESKN